MSDNMEVTPVETTQAQPQNESATDYLNTLKGQVDGLEKERGELRETVERSNKRLERLSAALMDEPDGEPESEEDKLMRMFKDAAREDEKAGGKGLPLTTKLAEIAIELKKQLKETRGELGELKKRHETTQAPEFKYDQAAFEKIDMQVQDAISSIYGEVDEHLFEAVSKDISKEIQRLKKESPQTWEEIRRNPEYIRRMSMHFVEKKIPPRAREILNAEKEKSTPMTEKELRQAFKEADQIKDPKSRAEIKSSIRQKILEHTYAKK